MISGRAPLLPKRQLAAMPRRVLLRSLLLSRHVDSPEWYPMITAAPSAQIRRDPTARLRLANQLLLGHWPEGPHDLRPALLAMSAGSTMSVDGWSILAAGSTTLVGNNANLTLGDGVVLNVGARITCMESVTIGPMTGIGFDAIIMDTDQHPIIVDGEERPKNAPVAIGEKVWIGARAIVLKGVTIGHGAVVAAGAVVASDVPPHTLVAGVPARVIRENIDWWP